MEFSEEEASGGVVGSPPELGTLFRSTGCLPEPVSSAPVVLTSEAGLAGSRKPPGPVKGSLTESSKWLSPRPPLWAPTLSLGTALT